MELQDRVKSNAQLTTLFENLKQTVFAAKASGTVNTYCRSLNRWIEFAKAKQLVVFPISVVDAALYFSHLSTCQVSASVIETNYCALKWVHEVAGVPNPMSNLFVKNIVEGAKRQNAKPVVKKDPITKEALLACCNKYEHCNDLPVRRNIAMALLLFAGFFRFSEISALTVQDVTIDPTHLVIRVTQSKTDQYRKGDEVVISRSDKVTCPVKNLERYLSLACIDRKHKDYLFKPLVKLKSAYRLIQKVKPISYTAARESIVSLLRKFMPASANISLHSFRAGGATAAANAQISDRCWKRHGRWRSESAKDGYVEDSIDARLLVTKSLGL